MLFFYLFIFFNIYSSKNPEKSITGYKKNLSSTTVSNIDNNSLTLKTGVMAEENSALHHRNKLYFKVY